MKRVIISATEWSSKYVIGVFNNKNQFIGYLFDYVETKGHSVVRCSSNKKKAKVHDSESLVKRAYGYYQHFSEIYVYEGSTIPSQKYKVFKRDVDPAAFNTNECTYHSIQGCYSKIQEV